MNMWNYGPQYLPNTIPTHQQPQFFNHQGQPQIQPPNQNPDQNQQHGHKKNRGRANSVSASTKRKNSSPDKVQPKKVAKQKVTPKKQHPKKPSKTDKKPGVMLFIGDLATSFHLHDEENATKLIKLCNNRLSNYSAEVCLIQATCANDYATTLVELDQFIGIKHPLLALVFICSSNTDLDFEQFFKAVCSKNILPECIVGVLPEPDSPMGKLNDNAADQLVAHRTLAYTIYSKMRRVNIVSLSNWNEYCEDKVGTRINKLFNKISSFEPENKKVLKFHTNVPTGKIAFLSEKGKELLKKD